MRSGWKTTNKAGRIPSSVLWTALLTMALAGLWAYSQTDKGPLRSRVYKLRHIDSTAAKALLQRLKIGVDYNALSSDVLIVTSDRSLDLVKATSVITVADRETPAEIRPLMKLGEDESWPKPEDLAVRLRTLSLGTLEDGPPTGVANPTIVDVFDGTLIGIGSPESLGMVETAIGAWQAEKALKEKPASEPAETPAQKAPEAEDQSEPQPSLAEVAEQLLSQMQAQNGVQPEADQPIETVPEQILVDAAKAAQAEEEVKAETAEEKQPEAAEPAEPSVPAEVPEVADDALRAALEKLIEGARAQEQTLTPREPETTEQAQEPAEAETAVVTEPVLPTEDAERELELTITLPEEVPIEDLIELVGKQLGLNYMYDKSIFQGQPGKVTIKINEGKIKVGDLYSLLESVLRFRGFVMTRRESLVTIARQDQLANMDPVLRKPDEPIQPGDVMVSSIFELKHISPVTAQTLIAQMQPGATFSAIAETGTLIVTDYAFRMERIRDIIKMIDVIGPPKEFKYRQLKYMQAADLVPKVQALAAQIQGVSVTVGATEGAVVQPTTPSRPETAAERARRLARERAAARARAQQAQAGQPPQPGQPSAETAEEMVYLEADERTNRVLMIGYLDELEIVNQLIDSLDVSSYDLRFVREYVIQYVEASEVITVLNELGLAQVMIGYGTQYQQDTLSRQQMLRSRQQMTPQQQQQLQQQQLQQQQMMTGGQTGTEGPSISLRRATNSLLVNATEDQHKAIELVIKHVDVQQKDQRTIQEYEIQYVDTQSILDTLTDLGIISPRETTAQASATMTGRTGAQQRQQQLQQQMMMPGMAPAEGTAALALPTADGTEKEISAEEPQIAVLTSTNSLLVHATPRQHAAIALVIAHADRQIDLMSAPYVVYALENQDPEELATVLTELIQETVDTAAGQAAATAPATDTRITTRPKATGKAILPSGEEERIKIIADPKTYSLVVYANKRNQQWVGELIRELDAYRPQVLLDCTLVQITKDESFKYDLDIVAKTYNGLTMNSNTPITTVSGDFNPSSVADARSTSGSFQGFFNSDMIQGLLEAVETKGYGRVMSKPKILVNDNQEGEIKTENKTSIAQKSSSTIPGSNGADPIITDEVNFNEYSEGVTLTIKPHISKGDMLRLEITLSRTDFKLQPDVTVANIPYPRPPDLISTDVKTVATVPDGTTIILGGLEDIDQQKNHSKVPILGDLPLIGGLFRGIDNQGNQGRLYVFVKANILRPSDQVEGLEDIKRVSGKYRQQFEEMEGAFQKAQDWPGIKPEPKYPEQVLEEDE